MQTREAQPQAYSTVTLLARVLGLSEKVSQAVLSKLQNNLRALESYPVAHVSAVAGVGPSTVHRLHMLAELMKRYQLAAFEDRTPL